MKKKNVSLANEILHIFVKGRLAYVSRSLGLRSILSAENFMTVFNKAIKTFYFGLLDIIDYW